MCVGGGGKCLVMSPSSDGPEVSEATVLCTESWVLADAGSEGWMSSVLTACS